MACLNSWLQRQEGAKNERDHSKVVAKPAALNSGSRLATVSPSDLI